MKRDASPPVLEAVIEELIAQGELVRRGDQIGLRAGVELSHRQRKLLDALLAECHAAGPTPPTLKEFAAKQGCTLRDLEPLVEAAVIEGRLDRISPDFVMDRAALETLRINLVDYFQQHPAITTSEIREHWRVTRRYAVPILEYFDRLEITQRDADRRIAGPRLLLPIGEVPP
jgi:selenocysteine-specific elongation factor